MPIRRLLVLGILLFIAVALSCGGNSTSSAELGQSCNCTPTKPESNDYRHAEKHVDLPDTTPQEITVADMLSWPQTAAPASDAPRTGRELQLFHIATAYIQQVYLNPGDCDIHFEISQTPDKTAPRVIVETPADPSYCSARSQIQAQLAAHGINLPAGGDVNPPLKCQVLGLAFEDFEHKRGTAYVKTVWELHPAIVTLLQ